MTPFIVGFCGGSGSGKTTLIRRIHNQLGPEISDIIFQDSYYRDQSGHFDHDGGSVNYDHPNALDFALLAEHLATLKKGEDVHLPQYDFSTHKRRKKTRLFTTKPIVLVDGILILSQPEVRKFFDHSCYIQCDESERLSRRIARDTLERGRTKEGVIAQFTSQVAPMHERFVAPSQRWADSVFKQNQLDKAPEQILQLCKLHLQSTLSSSILKPPK